MLWCARRHTSMVCIGFVAIIVSALTRRIHVSGVQWSQATGHFFRLAGTVVSAAPSSNKGWQSSSALTAERLTPALRLSVGQPTRTSTGMDRGLGRRLCRTWVIGSVFGRKCVIISLMFSEKVRALIIYAPSLLTLHFARIDFAIMPCWRFNDFTGSVTPCTASDTVSKKGCLGSPLLKCPIPFGLLFVIIRIYPPISINVSVLTRTTRASIGQ
jgi:hypothetical protein